MMKMKNFVLVLGVVISCFYLANAQVWKDSPRDKREELYSHKRRTAVPLAASDDLRLPTDLLPSNQLIRIQPFLSEADNFKTLGYTEIYFQCINATNVIKFHMMDIITDNDTISLEDIEHPGHKLPFVSFEHDLVNEMFVGTLQDLLDVGNNYFIQMQYQGYLNENLLGFYRSTYVNQDNETVYIGTTQMEPVDARRVVPCFDEPGMKVQFDIEMIRQGDVLHTISNMPLLESYEEPGQPGWYRDVFNRTELMSTYLIAFIVSDFVNINRYTDDGRVLFRVWSRNESINQAEYALDKGPDCLSFYEGYYRIDFPLPKQDMAAIPDFDAGAMENWGLITYRETALLYDENESSASNKQRVAVVIAHELAHMWFGDLVTMKWWTDLWLNEGFASYMEYLGTNAIESTFGMFDQFTFENVQYAFSLDSLESSHPVSIEVNDPIAIGQIFDAISYSKGGSIIRMMRYFLGEDTFRTGLTSYLNKYAYSNAEQDDLWRSMTVQAVNDSVTLPGATVKGIMDSWTLQMGYPVVDVAINGDQAFLTQNRYLRVQNENSTDNGTYLWYVPITWTDSTDPTFDQQHATAWMTTEVLALSGLSTIADWFVFNVDQSGYYRVNYHASNWQALIDQLMDDHRIFSNLTRSQLIDDSMNLARAVPGLLNYSYALSLNDYLVNETDYAPWVSALDNLGYLEEMFTFQPDYDSLRTYTLSLLEPLYNYVTFNDSLTDPHLLQLTRSMAVSWNCHLNQTDCVDSSTQLVSQWMSDSTVNPISANLKSTVYCTGVANGDQSVWDFMYNQYINANLGHEIDNLLAAMGCSTDLDVLESYLDMTFNDSESVIRQQDAYKVYRSVANNDAGNELAWDYLNTNWDLMAAYYGSASALTSFVNYAANEFNTPEQLQEVEDLKAAHAEALGESVSAIDNVIETISNNIVWMDNYYDVVVDWLDRNLTTTAI